VCLANTCLPRDFCCPAGGFSNILPKEHQYTSPCGIKTFFLPRSPGWNLARQLAGWQELLPGSDGRVWGDWNATFERTHSFDNKRLAQYLFGSTCLHLVGSQVRSRNNKRDLVADYFGLSPHFNGTACFKPSLDNWILDLNFHLGLDHWCQGVYLQIYLPIVRTKWDLGLHCNERNTNNLNQIAIQPDCYMSPGVVPALDSIRQALSGQIPFGDMHTPWQFGKFSCGPLYKTGVANIDVLLGWNFILTHDYHTGAYLQITLPTSNKPRGEYIFEPILGNAGYWELGGGFTGHTTLFEQGCQNISIYAKASFTSILRSYEIRSFDFKSQGPLSRYLLLKNFTAKDEYNKNLFNAINYNTHAVYAGGNSKVELACKLAYLYGQWGIDLGYDFYFKSSEHLCINPRIYPSDFTFSRLGIKGTEPVCDQSNQNNQSNRLPLSTMLQSKLHDELAPDNTTQNNATITHAGSPDVCPVLVRTRDLDLNSARVPRQITHKFFWHISYTRVNTCFEPQLGIGGEVEVDSSPKLLSSLNQWGIWLKGALAF